MNKKTTQARTKLAVLPPSGRTLPARVIRALADEELSRAFGSLTMMHENPTYDTTFPSDPNGLAKNDLVD
jgi:hypothetical protein